MNFLAQAGIGDRIQAIRKQHAIRSARALADLIPGDNVTESIVQNIEAGGKDDLLVSQLLNIAKALRVSPIFLLAPIATPSARFDIANLSSSFDNMTVVQFDAWILSEVDGAYHWATNDEHSERAQLLAKPGLHTQLRERSRLAVKVEGERFVESADKIAATTAFDTTEGRLPKVSRRIKQLTSYLAAAG
jgi:transcriptional regulator with XRE-family HTH domain